MINEEDHLRIQVMKEGMDLSAVYQLADQIDSALNDTLHFAFDSELGLFNTVPYKFRNRYESFFDASLAVSAAKRND